MSNDVEISIKIIFIYFSAVTGTCGTGYYSLAKATACTPCPAGYSCATNNAAPVVCASGTFSNGLATSCTTCDTGKACPSTTSDSGKYDCPLGNYIYLDFCGVMTLR